MTQLLQLLFVALFAVVAATRPKPEEVRDIVKITTDKKTDEKCDDMGSRKRWNLFFFGSQYVVTLNLADHTCTWEYQLAKGKNKGTVAFKFKNSKSSQVVGSEIRVVSESGESSIVKNAKVNGDRRIIKINNTKLTAALRAIQENEIKGGLGNPRQSIGVEGDGRPTARRSTGHVPEARESYIRHRVEPASAAERKTEYSNDDIAKVTISSPTEDLVDTGVGKVISVTVEVTEGAGSSSKTVTLPCDLHFWDSQYETSRIHPHVVLMRYDEKIDKENYDRLWDKSGLKCFRAQSKSVDHPHWSIGVGYWLKLDTTSMTVTFDGKESRSVSIKQIQVEETGIKREIDAKHLETYRDFPISRAEAEPQYALYEEKFKDNDQAFEDLKRNFENAFLRSEFPEQIDVVYAILRNLLSRSICERLSPEESKLNFDNNILPMADYLLSGRRLRSNTFLLRENEK